MEYLEMHGTVQLKTSSNLRVVDALVRQLTSIDLCDAGYVAIDWEGSRLSLNVEGIISESHSIVALLKQLQRQLADGSMIVVNRVRWEVKVLLRSCTLNDSLVLQPSHELALAQ